MAKKYKVLAPYVVFRIGQGTVCKEYSLKKGDICELPEDNISVRVMVARKQLAEMAAETPKKTKETNKNKPAGNGTKKSQ